MKDDKHYDGWKNWYETEKFKKELFKETENWKNNGMNEYQIKELTKFDKELFLARRRFYERNYQLFENVNHLVTEIDDNLFHINDYKDLELFIHDERLRVALKKYPAFRDVATIIANGDDDIKSIAKKLNKTDNAIHIILFKVRKLSENYNKNKNKK